MTYNMKTLIAAGCLALSMGSAVEAQTLGAISIEMDGWAYEPILNGGNIEAIVAVRIATSTSKVDALWLEPTPDGAWTAQAWNDVVPEEVAAYVFDHVGASTIDSSLDDIMGMWPIDLDPTMLSDFILVPMTPTPFGDGVFVGDALQAAIYANPGLLQPLETIGYPAVATLSGSTVSGGTFTGGGAIGPPSPVPGECIAVYDLLNVLKTSFESTSTDLDLIDQVFLVEYDLQTISLPNCGCPTRTWVLSSTGWTNSCDPWQREGPPVPTGTSDGGASCRYHWIRQVNGTRTRTLAHSETVFPGGNCVKQICRQTQFATGEEGTNTYWAVTLGASCPSSYPGTPPSSSLPCVSDYPMDAGPWIPARCPWE